MMLDRDVVTDEGKFLNLWLISQGAFRVMPFCLFRLKGSLNFMNQLFDALDPTTYSRNKSILGLC